MQTYYAIIAIALVIEAAVTTVKWAVKGQFNPWRLLAIVLAVALAIVYRVDLLAIAGITPAWGGLWWVGAVLTGLVMSRGANVVADFAKILEKLHAGEADVDLEAVPHETGAVEGGEVL